jgi:hypothetical protein
MLGVLLADARQWPDARAHIDRALPDAQLFLMDDAVRLASDPELLARIDAGLDATLCATDAAQFGVSESALGPRFGSQHDHARLVLAADEFIALTGAPARVQTLVGNTRAAAITLEHRVYPGLRAAVGYLTAGIDVTLFGSELIAHANAPTNVARAIATLRGLGHTIGAPRALPGALRINW